MLKKFKRKTIFYLIQLRCYAARMSTKLAIMDTAEHAVRKRGYNGFGLDQIARDVGIRKSSIYYHFSSKSELIAAIFRRFSDRIISFLDHTTSTEILAGDRLIAYLARTRSLVEEGESICLAIALNIDQQSLQAEIVDDLAVFHQTNIEWLTSIFELGLRDGSIAGIGDPKEEASACLALVDGAQLSARAHQDPKMYDEAILSLRSRVCVAAPICAVH